MRNGILVMLVTVVAVVMPGSQTSARSDLDARHPEARLRGDGAGAVQLGQRPMYLINGMDGGSLKAHLPVTKRVRRVFGASIVTCCRSQMILSLNTGMARVSPLRQPLRLEVHWTRPASVMLALCLPVDLVSLRKSLLLSKLKSASRRSSSTVSA